MDTLTTTAVSWVIWFICHIWTDYIPHALPANLTLAYAFHAACLGLCLGFLVGWTTYGHGCVRALCLDIADYGHTDYNIYYMVSSPSYGFL